MDMAKIAGRYEITAKLGAGGMGVVYRAYDPPPMDREVAVKTLHEFADPLALELFYKECTALKSISHPNIVEIFDMGEFEEAGHKKPFFVMPLLPGQTLDQLIRRESHRLTVERVVEIISQTCRGLQAAHERGLVHRDLKPSNIFVMADDSVKIIDFGVAHAVSVHSQSGGFDKGTLLYMAPEQVQHKPVSVQSDIYSLGVATYEALTRRQPFRGATEEAVVHAILTHIPPPASDLSPTVSHLISRVVHKAMAKQPWNRYDTAREFGETLQKASRNEHIAQFDPARTQPRIQTASKALERGDYQFAGEIVGELEAEGNIDPQLTLLRTQIDQIARQKTLAQLLESARARYEEEEDPLALQKIQEILKLDSTNVGALGLKSKIEDRRSERQIEQWIQLARQHVDNHSYGHAREALQNALLLRPKDSRALRLLKEIESDEQEYVGLRREKTDIYNAAVNAWKNGDVSEALSQMRLVLELDSRAPDASSPDATGTYQSFYNKIRSEHDAISSGYAEARRYLADKEFASALKICRDFLEKYPGQALFQALRFDVEEQQRQQLSAFIADVDRRLEAEPDLEAKVSLLREAVTEYPEEDHFKRLAKTIGDKRDLVNSIVERARLHEARSQFSEAVADLETLQTIYSVYPGLKFEKERLQKRLEQHTRDAARARWVRQIDGQLQAGNYTRAAELLDKAEIEFSEDAELAELRRLTILGTERKSRAERLVAEGQQLRAQGQFEQGVELLESALQLDDRPSVRLSLRDVFVAQAQIGLETNWRAAEAFADRALTLDPNHTLAKSLKAQALDKKREALIPEHVSQAQRLQAAGDIEGAIAEIENALASYPSDPRLSIVADALRKELGLAQEPDRLQDSEQPPAHSQTVESTRGEPPPQPPVEPTRLVPGRRQAEVDARTVVRSAGPIMTGREHPDAASHGDAGASHRPPRPPASSRRLVWAAVAVVAVIGAVAVARFVQRDRVSEVVVQENQPPEGQSRNPSEVSPPPDPVAAAPVSTPAQGLSTLMVQQAAPGMQVSLDDIVIGTVGPGGSLTYPGIKPGPHTLRFARPGYEPVTLNRAFAADETLGISSTDVTLRPASAVMELLADATTAVTVSQGGRMIQQLAGSTKLSVPAGSYEVVARGPAGVPTSETVSIAAGDSRTVDLRSIVTGMEGFAPGGWTRKDTWFTRRGGGFVLYNRTSPGGRVTFTVRLDRSRNPFSSGPRLKWVVGFVDVNNYALIQLDDEFLYRTEVSGGNRRELARVAHRIPDTGPFLHVSVEASSSQLIHQYSLQDSVWKVLDVWNRGASPPADSRGQQPTFANGKFGFYLPGSDELEVSNFLYYPPSR